jgi:hypothetical protein
MIDVTSLTAAQVLAIPLSSPETLFSGDEAAAKLEFRRLSHRWHPDINVTAEPGVFAHINVLYDLTIERLRSGTWRGAGELIVEDVHGTTYRFRYLRSRPHEFGDVYISHGTVAWSFTIDALDLLESGVQQIRNFHFFDDALRQEHTKYLPGEVRVLRTADRAILIMRKKRTQFALRDVLLNYGGHLDARHVAWILSSLYNLNCYLKLEGICHNDISLDTYFIDPAAHSGALLGGWWYAKKHGERLIALPTRTVREGPYGLVDRRVAHRATDACLIRALGRELLGDPVGTRLLKEAVPAPLVEWLRGVGDKDALEEYSTWTMKILKNSFGPRRFVPMELTSTDVYERA